MGLIDIDYRDTLKKADRLEALAQEIRTVATRDFPELQSGGSRNWQGSAAELYRKRNQALARQVEAQSKTLQRTARNLRVAAERYHRLELAANAIFGGAGSIFGG